jgi:hypothetical protein
MKLKAVTHRFVDIIPDVLDDGTIYVSIPYVTAVHKCCCGCGHEVVTPLSPTDWQLTFDGKTITLHPSIGSWNLACKSHYWVRRNVVVWARGWSKKKIETERRRDRAAKQRYYDADCDEV